MATDRYQNRYRPTERGNQFGNDGVGDIKKDTATLLEDIDVDLNRLDECVQSIGTSLDSQKNRNELNRLKGVIMNNVRGAEEDIKDLKQRAVGPQKVKVEQFQKKLSAQAGKFNTLLQRVKDEAKHQETDMNHDRPNESRQSGAQAQAQVGSGALATREMEHTEVLALEEDILGLHEIQHDLAIMVNEQGEMIDDIESHTTAAQARTENATRNLGKAVELKRANRRLICIIVIILVIVGVIVAIAIAIGVGVGVSMLPTKSPPPGG